MQFFHSNPAVFSHAVLIRSPAAFATLGALSSGAASVAFEAESGALGSDWAVSTSNRPAITTASNPGSTARVAASSVMFPATGACQFCARVRVGPDTFNDDGPFYVCGSGRKSPTLTPVWVLVNGLGDAGFNNSTELATLTNANSFVFYWCGNNIHPRQ